MQNAIVMIYHPNDVEFTARVAQNLLARGLVVWADFFLPDDQRDTETAYQVAAGFVSIISPSFDMNALVDLPDDKVFPIVIEETSNTTELSNQQTTNFIGWGDLTHFDSKLNELVEKLRSQTNVGIRPNFDPVDQYIYSLMTECSIASVNYETIPVESELKASDNDDDTVVIVENDNLGERIARQAEEATNVQDDNLEGLTQFESISALHQKQKSFIIVGQTGIGKTIALKRLALEAAWRFLADRDQPLPVYLDLPAWDDGISWPAFLEDQLGKRIIENQALQNRKYFLDHLDGLSPRNADLLEHWIVDRDETTSICLAIDINFYSEFHNVPIVIIKTAKFRQETINKLKILIEHADQSTSTLAKDMIQKGNRYYTTVLEDSRSRRGFLSKKQKQTPIAKLIEDKIIVFNKEKFKFKHTIIQSIFAASAIEKTDIQRLLTAPQFNNQRRLPTRWDQAIIFRATHFDNASEFIEEVAAVDPFLALGCIEFGAKVDADTKKQVAQQLLNILEQNDWRQSIAAIAGIKRLDEPMLVETMINYMAYGDLYQRRLAARVFGEIKHPAGIPLLADALKDEAIRAAASEALVNIGHPVVPEIVKLINPDDAPRWETRTAAIEVLWAVADPRTTPILIEALFDEADEVLWTAARALAALKKDAITPLVEFIQSEDALIDEDICQAAAMAIIWTDEADGVIQLSKLLDDPVPLRRGIIADTLGGASGTWLPLAINKLAERLHDEDVIELDGEALTISEIVLRSLEEIGTPEALQIIKKWQDNT